jgi:predicted O-linked N-acetylglucosamine transferase (SPINDLY family)
VICYSIKRRRDNVTTRIEALVDRWHDVTSVADAAMAELIRADGIDILIDISGHTNQNRLPTFALKPAPVQASWLGYPFTTGLAAIDYAIMDEVSVRPGEESLFVETVFRLPGGRFCFEPPAEAPPVTPPPALRRGSITFGSFNNITKVTPETLDAWSRILAEIPDARLVLKSWVLSEPAAAGRLIAAMRDRGVNAERLDLRGSSPHADMLAEYGDIDIALDPFPFSGGMTTFEALWMGLPVVTLPGGQPASRQTEWQLRAIGRSEWVARDVDDYVSKACDLARDTRRLADLRKDQRETIRNSSLCDKARLGRELGSALRHMWQAYLGGND